MDFDWLADLKRDRLTDDRTRDEAANASVVGSWRVDVCAGRSCTRAGSKALRHQLMQLLDEYDLLDDIEVRIVGCRDRCDFSPSWDVYPGPTRYCRLTPAAVYQVVEEHLCEDDPVGAFQFHPSMKRMRR